MLVLQSFQRSQSLKFLHSMLQCKTELFILTFEKKYDIQVNEVKLELMSEMNEESTYEQSQRQQIQPQMSYYIQNNNKDEKLQDMQKHMLDQIQDQYLNQNVYYSLKQNRYKNLEYNQDYSVEQNQQVSYQKSQDQSLEQDKYYFFNKIEQIKKQSDDDSETWSKQDINKFISGKSQFLLLKYHKSLFLKRINRFIEKILIFNLQKIRLIFQKRFQLINIKSYHNRRKKDKSNRLNSIIAMNVIKRLVFTVSNVIIVVSISVNHIESHNSTTVMGIQKAQTKSDSNQSYYQEKQTRFIRENYVKFESNNSDDLAGCVQTEILTCIVTFLIFQLMRYNRLYIVDNMMSKKFQYNFTAQNQLIELRDRINELQEENTLLKQSLEELIRVNTELTQSIQQFNTDNNQLQYQQHQIEEMTHTIEMLNNQIEEVKRENQILNGSPIQTKKFSSDEAETESLVLVLEQLIESFKNMQARYENQIQQFQQKFDSCKGQYQQMLLKMQQAYEQKLETLQPILTQLARKDENLLEIQRKIKDIQNNKDDKKSIYYMNTINKINPRKSRTYRDLQEKLQEKQNVISFLLETLNKLKVKFMQKL